MAEFKCYECGKTVKTGEKFTFTKKGSVHFECFIGSKRKEVAPEKQIIPILGCFVRYCLMEILNLPIQDR